MASRNVPLGFTLIEYAIIVVIIGILVTATIIPFYRTSGANLNAEAERIASDIRYIQFQAMTLNERLRINFSSNQYSFTEADGTTVVNHPAVKGNVVQLPSGVTLTTNLPNNYLIFDSLGVPYTDNASTPTALSSLAQITLSLSGESNRIITVNQQTGKVDVQ